MLKKLYSIKASIILSNKEIDGIIFSRFKKKRSLVIIKNFLELYTKRSYFIDCKTPNFIGKVYTLGEAEKKFFYSKRNYLKV